MANSVDVTLGSTVELVLSGGPASLDVEVDFGAQGERGTKTFIGYGNPNATGTNFPDTPIALDMFINIAQYSEDAEYLSMYQYVVENGALIWKYVATLLPTVFSDNYQTTFVAGEAHIDVPLNAFVPESILSTVEADMFNVQINVGNLLPVAVGATAGQIQTTSGLRTLTIDLNAVEFDTGEWVALEGQKTVQLFITMV